MTGTDKTPLGDRMKSYERQTSPTLMPGLPVLARIDGKCFSAFTSGLGRPYDVRLSLLMVDTTRYLVERTNALCGYTQSDEITLVWKAAGPNSEIFFEGKLLKMVSVTAAMATAFFNRNLALLIPEKAGEMPVFDSRVWTVPSDDEAVNCFVWREQDTVRNSIQMAARAHFSHRECDNKSGNELQEMLHSKGINWNDYPAFFKRGTYVRRRVIERQFTTAELDSLPPKHHARTNPDLPIRRSVIMAEEFPPILRMTNRVDVIMQGADPTTATGVERMREAFVGAAGVACVNQNVVD